MIVVTSPIGDHAPPAFADKMIMPANSHLSSLSLIIFPISVAITIAVVKLSKAAEKKKVIVHKIHINLTFLVVLILSVIIAKPS